MSKIQKNGPVRVRLVNERWFWPQFKEYGKIWETRYYWKEFSSIEALHQFLLKYGQVYKEPDKLHTVLWEPEEDLTLDQYILLNNKGYKYVQTHSDGPVSLSNPSAIWTREWKIAQERRKRQEKFLAKHKKGGN